LINRGQVKHCTAIQAVEDVLIRNQTWQITVHNFWQQVNKVILPALCVDSKDSISERTAKNWLHRLGYASVEGKMVMYEDGHEWPNVVESQVKFLHLMKEFEWSVIVRATPHLII
jgi:hypothetical protein